MPIYTYQGRNERTGDPVSGMREAVSHSQLGQDLLQEGILLTEYREKKESSETPGVWNVIFKRVPIVERVLFARYFSLMLKAGLDIKQSLAALAEQARSAALKEAIMAIKEKIERGLTLAESMIEFPLVFSTMFVSFVKVGEATGRLQESLKLVAEQLQKDYELRRAVRGGLMYPAVIVTALIATGIAMLIFVVPKLAEVFTGFDVELPLATRALIWSGNFVTKSWWLVLILLAAAIVSAFFAWRNKKVKDAALNALMYAPIIGPIMQQVNLARFSRNLSSLLSSGMSFVEALDIMGKNTPHPGYARAILAAKEHVKQGKPLSEFLKDYKRLFVPLVINVIKVGEETGELDTVLREVASFYEDEVDSVMKNLTSVIEPILMVVVGLAVGALALSVIAPIYSLVNVI